MSSEMVERIARAIYEGRNGRGYTPWAHLAGAHKNPYLSYAVAALKAMREPSPGMLEAGTEAFVSQAMSMASADEVALASTVDIEIPGLSSAYRAMIDHEIMLAEGGNDE